MNDENKSSNEDMIRAIIILKKCEFSPQYDKNIIMLMDDILGKEITNTIIENDKPNIFISRKDFINNQIELKNELLNLRKINLSFGMMIMEKQNKENIAPYEYYMIKEIKKVVNESHQKLKTDIDKTHKNEGHEEGPVESLIRQIYENLNVCEVCGAYTDTVHYNKIYCTRTHTLTQKITKKEWNKKIINEKIIQSPIEYNEIFTSDKYEIINTKSNYDKNEKFNKKTNKKQKIKPNWKKR
jgi:hypothetical protein